MSQSDPRAVRLDRPPVEGIHRSALAILDAIGQAVIATDLDGEVTYWSPAAEALYGWTADEAIGRPIFVLTPSGPFLDRAHEVMTILREEGSWTGEFELVRRDGSKFTGLVTNAVIRDDDGHPVGIVGVSSDLSDLKDTELALRERIKEFRTLIGTTAILSDDALDRDARLQRFVEQMPEGWLDPESTEVRLTVNNRVHRSPGFAESEDAISARVVVRGDDVGSLEVVRTSVPAGGPSFIPEEVELLAALARAVGDSLSHERLSVRLFRSIEALEEAVLVLEESDGERRIVMVNAAAETIFGYDRDELVGGTIDALYPNPDEFQVIRTEAVRALREDGVFSRTSELVRRSGEVFPADQTISLLDPERGLEDGLVYVVRDVSDQQRARAELLRAQERFSVIAEHLQDVLWIGSPIDRQIEYVSPAFGTVWGRDPADLYRDPLTWLEAIHPADRDRVARMNVLVDPRERDTEYRIVRPDGEIRWIHDRTFPVRDDEGDVVRIIGIAADITDRRRAEERLNAISGEISDAIYVLDSDGHVRFATSSIERNTGYSIEQFEGQNALDLVHPEDRERVRETLAWVAQAPNRSTRVEYRFLDHEAEERDVESLARNLSDHPGIGGILVTTRDVSDRVRMERALRESQRLEAVGRLAGGIAHDFNNLLTVIRSQASLLQVDLADSEASADVKVIEEAADRAAQLTGQLLAFSREQVLQPRPVNLSDIVARVATLVERVIGSDIALMTRLPGDLPTVELDPGQLEQVLLNLAINARDAMPGGGTLALETRRRIVGDDSDTFSAILPGTYTELVVSDSGVGMEPDVASRVFEPFFTTKSERGGTGLGLATAYGFVRQSGGDISLHTRPNEGTTFRLVFPAVDEAPQPVEPTRAPALREMSVAGRVLLVEDEETVRRVAVRILERSGLEVEGVGSAEDAVEFLERGGEVHAVVTDLGLPGMSGRDLVDWCRDHRPDLPVAVMSGYAAESPGGRRGIPADVEFLPKPFTPRQLVQTVRDLVTSSGGGA